jgi:hypothetical protein
MSRVGHARTAAQVFQNRQLLANILRDRHLDWAWQRPAVATYEAPKRAHSSAHIYAVEEAFANFDPDTPAYPKIYKHAARARRSRSPAKRCAEIEHA